MTSLSFLRQMLQDVRHQKVRTTLTLLGITWGTVSVSLLVAFGQGLEERIRKNQRGLGENIVIARPARTSIPWNGLGALLVGVVLWRDKRGWFWLGYTFVPLAVIFLLSFWKPLYHVRYLFIYASGFYILLALTLDRLLVRFAVRRLFCLRPVSALVRVFDLQFLVRSTIRR